MKELATVTKKGPSKRLEATEEFLTTLNKNEKASEVLQKWAMKLEKKPITISGQKIDAGQIEMGKQVRFDIENNKNIDRQAQTKLHREVQISKPVVFCLRSEFHLGQSFLNMLKTSMDDYDFPIQRPELYEVDSSNWDSWERCIKNKVTRETDFVILILPGGKKNSPFYNDAKRLFINEIPIPIQVVLQDTLKGKNVRSINKILV
eukprot:CAMPEP_0114581674 /NCGR_PEP_ID=MMETSP0125-20121206/5758_1 /TAXON_ID=485358 ORGANISM="Aristerostoma sp., Strain ATCC 50986" /NCGR_SAMPLE_ID=MMETSP0125 /ASSEMBLY_ACC=CAM_ASM_000245 /LENGTH=204 /DNA_ID=CAMNT_0001774069 /DNA_START=425 /DNA_END=1039 /DNA_ORIENTATION=+